VGDHQESGHLSRRRARYEPSWVAKTSSGAGLVCVWRGWWSAYGEPLVAKSPELGFNPTQPPPNGGALAPLVVSTNYAHLRVWEVDWGNVPLDLCVVLVRESLATWLAGAGRGLAFLWFVPLTLWWVHCNTHSFMPCARMW
jgi:hypothetical protein